MFIAGILLCDIFFNIQYVYEGNKLALRIDKNEDSLFNRIVYGFQFLGFTMSIIGVFRLMNFLKLYIDFSYFIAVKVEFMRIFRKVKAKMKL